MKLLIFNYNKLVQVISILLVLIWMSTIFYFSSEIAVDSSETSSRFILPLVKFFRPNLTGTALYNTVESLQFIVRKLAHFVLYTIGGILLYNMYSSLGVKEKMYKVILPFLTGVFYAMTDEIHQFFVEGRSCEIRDVLIDSLGIALGICIIYCICCIINKKTEDRK